MELNVKKLDALTALDTWHRLEHFLPTGGYPLNIDNVHLPDLGSGDWSHGVVGGEAEIDLDFETKKGGPWGAWITSRSRDLYVVAHPDAPVDRLLYFIARRQTCFLNVAFAWHSMVTAASMAGFTNVGNIPPYGIWSRQGSQYYVHHS